MESCPRTNGGRPSRSPNVVTVVRGYMTRRPTRVQVDKLTEVLKTWGAMVNALGEGVPQYHRILMEKG